MADSPKKDDKDAPKEDLRTRADRAIDLAERTIEDTRRLIERSRVLLDETRENTRDPDKSAD
jgi:hypothetical protein